MMMMMMMHSRSENEAPIYLEGSPSLAIAAVTSHYICLNLCVRESNAQIPTVRCDAFCISIVVLHIAQYFISKFSEYFPSD